MAEIRNKFFIMQKVKATWIDILNEEKIIEGRIVAIHYGDAIASPRLRYEIKERPFGESYYAFESEIKEAERAGD